MTSLNKSISLGFGIIILTLCGCSSNYSLLLENQTGRDLEAVSIRSNGAEFTFGKVTNGGLAGYMTPSNKFGSLPDSMRLDFVITDTGEQMTKTVDFSKVRRAGEIIIRLDKNLHASAENN